jgi:hypothetical protein
VQPEEQRVEEKRGGQRKQEKERPLVQKKKRILRTKKKNKEEWSERHGIARVHQEWKGWSIEQEKREQEGVNDMREVEAEGEVGILYGKEEEKECMLSCWEKVKCGER